MNHAEVEAAHGEPDTEPARVFFWAIMQIIVIDIVFSLDSIITAMRSRRRISKSWSPRS